MSFKTTVHALAFFAAVCAASSAGAAVIQISSNDELSPQYAVTGRGVGRLVGTISGTLGSSSLVTDPPESVTVLPWLEFYAGPPPGGRIYRLDPVVASPGAGFTADVDLAIDLEGVASFEVRPDAIVAPGEPSSVPYYARQVRFVGTLSTGADVGVQNVPEPAALALFGAGLVGLLATRRRWTVEATHPDATVHTAHGKGAS